MSKKAYVSKSGRKPPSDKKTVEERFWPKVDKSPGHGPNGDCWVWTASVNKKYGYGNFCGPEVRAHRMAYVLSKGEIPEGLIVMHSCDNRRCCNPSHLSVGTPKDNTQDMVRKGRHISGFVLHKQNATCCIT